MTLSRPNIKAQEIRLLHSKSCLYRELFCGVAEADWHAADDSIISDIKAMESLVSVRSEIRALTSSGTVFGVNIGFMTAACAGDLFLTQVARSMKSGVIEITEHGIENMSPERMAAALSFCAKARKAGYRIVLDDISSGYPLLEESFFLKAAPYAVKAVIGIERIESLARMAAGREVLMIVENIESKEDMVRAAALGANAVQGYLIGRPSPIASIGS